MKRNTDATNVKNPPDAKNPPDSVTVVGLGLMGGSVSLALRKEGIRVVGVSGPRSLEKAKARGAIDEAFGYDELETAVRKSAVVFLCTPLLLMETMLPRALDCASGETIVTDVGSTKSGICDIAERRHDGKAVFIGGHPMAGSEKRGVENADPNLFYDAVWVLTPTRRTPKHATNALSALILSVGAKVMLLDPVLHDRIAARVSHLPQLVAVLLVNSLAREDSDLFRNLAAGGFRDMTRIASSSYDVWRDILSTNSARIREELRAFGAEVSTLLGNIDDEEYLEGVFSRANEERMRLPSYSKGFVAPLCDIRVTVPDRPGELARITGVISACGINIKDIEIVTVREGEGGVLRLGFETKKDAERSVELLRGAGYEVRVL
ncbi:MAG: prephenate dehydrogenase [Spirochaetes bacterium]|nr:prephenate dehydrogenase [Spirochaetota bacterium]